jgi:hypothetical protein
VKDEQVAGGGGTTVQPCESSGVPVQADGDEAMTVRVCVPFAHAVQSEYVYEQAAGGGGVGVGSGVGIGVGSGVGSGVGVGSGSGVGVGVVPGPAGMFDSLKVPDARSWIVPE